jgi:uncharacterized protein (DUF1501 family)
MNFKHNPERRDVLKTATAMAVAGGLPTLESLTRAAHAAGGVGTSEVGNEYKAIVCIFMYGGQDHANLLMPYRDGNAAGNGAATTTDEYARYAFDRSNDGATDAAKKAQTMAPGTGNLSYSNASLAATALPATTSNSLPESAPLVGDTARWTTNTYGRQFALHPSFTEMKAIYDAGHLAVMANVGPLLSRVNRDQWFMDTHGALPINLYSHDDQQRGWMSGTSNVANPSVGVGGRIAAVPAIHDLNRVGGVYSKVSTQVSINGTNAFMLTDVTAPPTAIPYQMGYGSLGRLTNSTTCNTGNPLTTNTTFPFCLSGGPIRLSSRHTGNSHFMGAINSRYNAGVENVSIYHDQWRNTMRASIDTEQSISAAFLASPVTENVLEPFNAADQVGGSTNHLARQLRMVAAMIRASNQLGPQPGTPIKRQVFFVGIGGFDTHGDEFWRENPKLNRQISSALGAFWTALGRIQVVGAVAGTTAQDRVTTFTMSEFGRTLDSNGDGSDHGWGNTQFVMGKSVTGGKIYGNNHNVNLFDIPTDTRSSPAVAGQKSRFMFTDLNAGAVPRTGVPPTWWQGSNIPAGDKAKVQVPGSSPPRYIYLNHSLERGELIPTMASDAMVATIAKWFGVPDASITGGGGVCPTVAGVHGTKWDVGFMKPG